MREQPESIDTQIAAVQERLTEARARIPAHTTPPGLMAEIDDLERELDRLKRAQAQNVIAGKITECLAEIDDLEEALARLRAAQKG